MNLDFSRQTFAIEGRANKCFSKFNWPPAFDFLETILLNDVRHLFLLLLALIDLLLQIGDLFCKRVETVTVRRTITDRANKRGISILERLWND